MKKSLLFTQKIVTLLTFALFFPFVLSAQWSPRVNLSPNAIMGGLNESMGSCIGVSGDTVHVVWTEKHSAVKAVLYYTQSVDTGLTWSTPVAITDTNGNAWNPAIAVYGSSVHVVWREIDTLTHARISRYKHSLDGGNTWTSDIFIDSTSDWPAVSAWGNNVYIANDRHITASNSEIFFLRSTDNGATWSPEQQLTFADFRSEDEAIHAEGSHVHMSWNDNRTGQFQIFYKESADYGVTWGPDVVVDLPSDYSTMVWSDGAHVDVVAAGAPSGRYQLLLAQSVDTGATWGATGADLSNDTAHGYFYPDMVRDSSNLHVVCGGSAGAKYFHSADGGVTWNAPVTLPGANFIAYTGCALHVIYADSGKIHYLRNPTGNTGRSCVTCTIPSQPGSIAGSVNVCAGSANIYSIAAVTGATSYTWELPPSWTGDSTSVSVNTTAGANGGNITVMANSACGSSPVQTLNVTVTVVDTSVTPVGSTLTANDTGAAYQWLDCGNGIPVAGETNQSFTPTSSGSYAVVVTVNGCTDTSSCYTVTITGITEKSSEEKIIISPNPFSKQTTIEISSSGKTENAGLKVFDVLGQEVVSATFGNDRKIILGRDKLNGGVYFYKVLEKDKVVAIGKMIAE